MISTRRKRFLSLMGVRLHSIRTPHASRLPIEKLVVSPVRADPIDIGKQTQKQDYECNIFVKLCGEVLIVADFNKNDKKDSHSLLLNLIKKLNGYLVREEEFEFPLPILPEKTKEQARFFLNKRVEFIISNERVSRILVLLSDDLLDTRVETTKSHSLAMMLETPNFRKELWEQLLPIKHLFTRGD